MHLVLFARSVTSDRVNPGAHFLRGVMSELLSRGHEVRLFQPQGSDPEVDLQNRFNRVFRHLQPESYNPRSLDLDSVLDEADVVLVQEGTSPDLVRRLGEARRRLPELRLLFFDAHHRAVTEPSALAALDLSAYDAVLVAGEALRRLYVTHGWAKRVLIWREGADTRLFCPQPKPEDADDVSWIGGAGDDDRQNAMRELLLEPMAALGLRGTAHGDGYSKTFVNELESAGLRHAGWIPNWDVPRALARAKVTVHLPRRPYVRHLPGIPTIRVFEALACGVPLISGYWEDVEHLFEPGDYLVARDAEEMRWHLDLISRDADVAELMAMRGRERILERHTCRHRATDLEAMIGQL